CKYNLVFPLNNLESHLNSEIGGHTSRKAVCIGLVEHMVLCGVCGLGFPLRIVRNLSSLAAIIVEDYATSLIDVGGGGCHVITSKVWLPIRTLHPSPLRSSAAPAAATRTAPTLTSARSSTRSTTRCAGTGSCSLTATATATGSLRNQALRQHHTKDETEN